MKHLYKILITILFSFIFSFNVYSLGAGIQMSYNPALDFNTNETKLDSHDGNITGTVHLFRIPAVFGFGLEFGSNYSDFYMGTSGFFDYWFIEHQIKNTWNLYSGAGITARYMFNFNNSQYIEAGPRIFAGMNWLFLDNYIEYYLQLTAVPEFLYNFSSQKYGYRLSTPIETGVRLHF